MADLSEIKSIKSTQYEDEANFYLKSGGILLAVAPGQWEDKGAYLVYSVGFKVSEEAQPKALR